MGKATATDRGTGKTPWYRRKWVWAVVGILILFALIPGADDEDTTADTPPTTPAATAEAEPEAAEDDEAAEPEATQAEPTEPETTGEDAPGRTPEEAAVPEGATEEEATEDELGAVVHQALLDGNAVSSFRELSPESPGYWIADIETVSSSTVRVHVQEALTGDEREVWARWVLNMSCLSVPDLDTVVINDTSGIDSNHYLRTSGTIPGCQD